LKQCAKTRHVAMLGRRLRRTVHVRLRGVSGETTFLSANELKRLEFNRKVCPWSSTMRLNLLQTPHNGVVVRPNLWETYVTDHAFGCIVNAPTAMTFGTMNALWFTKSTHGFSAKPAFQSAAFARFIGTSHTHSVASVTD
jgi:hypothetical protein